MTLKNDPYKPNQQTDVFACPKWIRVYLGGKCIANSIDVKLVRESGQLPVYYFPQQDIEMGLLTKVREESGKSIWSITVEDTVTEESAWSYSNRPEIEDYIAFQWNKMDEWFEEDEQVYVHARDPFKRIDVIASSRAVEVNINGHTVAQTERPVLLFETGLPIRYYIPKIDVRQDLMVTGNKQTRCPYKGNAVHHSFQVEDEMFENIAWSYPFPTPEMSKIKNMVAFYHERLDDFIVNGERLEKAKTPWS